MHILCQKLIFGDFNARKRAKPNMQKCKIKNKVIGSTLAYLAIFMFVLKIVYIFNQLIRQNLTKRKFGRGSFYYANG